MEKIKTIKRACTNKNKGDTLCKQILGEDMFIDTFASFYKNNIDNLELLKMSLLMDYCNSTKFTPEELISYKLGLNSVIGFFSECEEESILREKNKMNEKSKE